MYRFINVTSSMYNNWFLPNDEYLSDFLPSDNLMMVFESYNNDDGKHNNITIGYEEYSKSVSISLEK